MIVLSLTNKSTGNTISESSKQVDPVKLQGMIELWVEDYLEGNPDFREEWDQYTDPQKGEFLLDHMIKSFMGRVNSRIRINAERQAQTETWGE